MFDAYGTGRAHGELGLGALGAVPEPQAVVIVAALVVQAVNSHRTLRGTA